MPLDLTVDVRHLSILMVERRKMGRGRRRNHLLQR